MSMEWLTVRSFRRMQDLLAAINTLSIHMKLTMAGVPDEGRVEQASHARQILLSFLKELEKFVQVGEQANEQPVMGADPRLRQLARNYIQARRDRQRYGSMLFRDAVSRTEDLLCSDRPEDWRILLQCLNELRMLLEEYLPSDARLLLGEF